eukprot:Nitzschia sp. Nitz4//scaffold89_size161592//14355//15335//NITZ4_002361-RA/size161592-processed-gene-0.34-mRNA-1//-1//CDS//3329559565//2812//frame0
MPRRQRDRNAIAADCRSQIAEGCVRFAIRLAYDGTNYKGFQSQPHGNTIQDNIEKRLQQLLRRPLRVFGWGRTDSGVHAAGAVCTVDLGQDEVQRLADNRSRKGSKDSTENEDETDPLLLASRTLHSALRDFSCDGGSGSITALRVLPVAGDFDARFSCLWKRYVYYIACGTRDRSPFLQRFVWQMDHVLNVSNMELAAALLRGEHNFAWTSVQQEGELRDPCRRLDLHVQTLPPETFGVWGKGSTILRISGTCDFFLYRMMRRLVGILVAIGREQVSLTALEDCIVRMDTQSASDESKGGIPRDLCQTAPPVGLSLDHIEYPIEI